MSIKKMMMLAMSLAALVAFAAPAAASAHLEWYESATPEDVTLEGEAELHIVGALETSVPSTGLVNVSCPVTFSGTASNSGPEGAAHGAITEGSVNEGGECATNLSFAGCNITKVSLNFGEKGWTLTSATPDHVIIDDATFVNHYNSVCQNVFGLPSTVPATGTVEGTLTNNAGPNGEDCVSFEEAGGLAVEGGGPAVILDGEVCITLPLTLH